MRCIKFLLVLFILVIGGKGYCAHRIVLFEDFNNTDCPVCATADPTLNTMRDTYTPMDITPIEYHTWWPDPADPFYSTNTTENTARVNYYSVTGVPRVIEDGYYVPSATSLSQMVMGMYLRWLEDSPLRIEAHKTIVGSICSIFVTINVGRPVSSTPMLRIAILESDLYYSAPNGVTHFNYVLRDMVPNATGISLTLNTAPDVQEFVRVATLNAGWAVGNINVIAFVQDDDTKEVVQSASDFPAPATHFRYFTLKSAAVSSASSTDFFAYIQNTGAADDDYQVAVTGSYLPAGWSMSYRTSAGTYSGSSTLPLDSGESDSMIVTFNTGLAPGSGWVTIRFTSTSDHSQYREITFELFGNLDVLVVSDDGDDSYDHYFTDALDALDVAHNVWDIDVMGSPTADDMGGVDAVVWFTGFEFPTLSSYNRSQISLYLDSGGKLFMTGQDIGWDLCDTDGSAYGTGSVDFYHNYLCANYLADDTDDHTLDGVAGDPVSNGISLAISGGDGANNQGFPSEIEQRGSASEIFYYSAGVCGGIKCDTGTFKVVYLSFGYEAINNSADRLLLMDRILTWFGLTLEVEENDALKPDDTIGMSLYPNPFNENLKIEVDAPGSSFSLEIYDILGKNIRTLIHEEQGRNSPLKCYWNGLDNKGSAVSSGIYYIIMKSGNCQDIKRVILLK
ncbi:Omp28-related outer membrane protein [bacterium]|nr:Omp28-related outer membrane protein [bacterium]